MYELAATSRQERPQPMTKVHPTKPPYFLNLAEGQKKIAPGRRMKKKKGFFVVFAPLELRDSTYRVNTESGLGGFLSIQRRYRLASVTCGGEIWGATPYIRNVSSINH